MTPRHHDARPGGIPLPRVLCGGSGAVSGPGRLGTATAGPGRVAPGRVARPVGRGGRGRRGPSPTQAPVRRRGSRQGCVVGWDDDGGTCRSQE